MEKRISWFATLFLACGVLLCISAGTRGEPGGKAGALRGTGRIGYVDISAVSAKSKFTREFKARVLGELQAKIEPFMSKKQQVDGIQGKLEKQAGLLSDGERTALVKQKASLLADLETDQFKIEKLRKEADKEVSSVYDRIIAAVETVGQREGYDMIIRREELLYGSPAVDVSAQVIAALDDGVQSAPVSKKEGLGKATPMPLPLELDR